MISSHTHFDIKVLIESVLTVLNGKDKLSGINASAKFSGHCHFNLNIEVLFHHKQNNCHKNGLLKSATFEQVMI